MLSKEVCKRCTIANFRGINDEVGEIVMENPEDWWSWEDERYWNERQQVYCPNHGHISILKPSPKYCPYELEHVICQK